MSSSSSEQATELVEARELTVWSDQDEFRHRDFADQLAVLAVTVPTPANIALYGPWGSGKTGVGNLVAERLKQQDFKNDHHGLNVKFARFDAFKYAETPLRRHFLSQVSDQLLGKKDAAEFREGLYHSEVTSRINFDRLKSFKVIVAFLLILGLGLVLAGLAAVVAAGIAVWASGEGDPGFVDRALSFFSSAVGFSFAPAAVLGGLFALAGNTLPVSRTKASPSSDEQFEDQFSSLLEKARVKRLVVFVDELDRCSPHQVVDILDTIRTFLDVDGTVFIVAADQNVLERALTERVRQTTPSDATNPYYSSGSAYLDKVFHYQTSLPSLLPGRVTRYAVDLVRGRAGLWSNPGIDVDWLISVLIPTHVRSPRRVKTLVNNYVLAYRLAEQRFDAGHLSTSPVRRHLELAKLVTLRTEFPRFARELPLSRRLPELLLNLAENPDAIQPRGVSAEVWAKAKVFARGDEDVATMLDDRDEPDVNPDDEAEPEESARDTSAAMLQQLLHYLQKTRHITNPHRDLIFLEAQGSLFNLDESVAEDVEDIAVDGRTDELVRLVNGLAPSDQTNVVRLLAQQTREAFPGVEGQNLVEALLAVAGSRDSDVLEPCADEAFKAVNIHGNYRNVSEHSLTGALQLAVGTNHSDSELVHHVLARDAVLTNAELGSVVLTFGDQLADHGDRVGQVAALRLLTPETARDAANALHSLDRMTEVLRAVHPSFEARLAKAAETDDTDPPTDPSESQTHRIATALEKAADEAASVSDTELLSFVVAAAFRSETSEYWHTASTYLDNLDDAPHSTEARTAALRRASQVTPADIQAWLTTFPERFAVTADCTDLTDDVAKQLWDARAKLGTEYDEHDKDFIAALEELARIGRPHPWDEGQTLVEQIDSELVAGPVNAGTAAQAAESWGHLRRFVEHHMVEPAAAASLVVRRLSEALAYTPNPPSRPAPDDATRRVLERWAIWAASNAGPSDTIELVQTIVDCTWVPEPQRSRAALQVAAEGAHRHPGSVKSPVTSDEVRDLAAEHGTNAVVAVGGWLREFADSPTDVTAVLRYCHRDYWRIRDDVLAYVSRLGGDERFVLASNEITTSHDDDRRLNVGLLNDAQFDEANESAAADLLVAEYARTGRRNSRRRELMRAWKTLRPQSKSVRRRLIEEITIPTLTSGGQEGYQIVIQEMGLLTNPEGVKRQLKEALRVAAPMKKRAKLEREMARHHITKTERTGLLGLTKREVHED